MNTPSALTWLAALLACGAMTGVSLLAANLWRRGQFAERAAAAVLLAESLALVVLAVIYALRTWSGSDAVPASMALLAMVPGLIGVVIGLFIAAKHSNSDSASVATSGEAR
jgi:hypothetical protein